MAGAAQKWFFLYYNEFLEIIIFSSLFFSQGMWQKVFVVANTNNSRVSSTSRFYVFMKLALSIHIVLEFPYYKPYYTTVC